MLSLYRVGLCCNSQEGSEVLNFQSILVKCRNITVESCQKEDELIVFYQKVKQNIQETNSHHYLSSNIGHTSRK